MPRKGRGTELILKELESLTLNGQAKIKSPDYIMDIVTGRKREVDISIRHNFGTHKFLTIIECRDRKCIEDVTWIEQLVTKTKNLQANKIVAVSTNGFTDGAKKLGKHENIVLRIIRDFKANEIKEWMKLYIVGIVKKEFDVIGIIIELEEVNKGKPITINFDTKLNDKIIKNDSNEVFSLIDMITLSCNQNPNLFNDLTGDTQPFIKKINIIPDNKLLIMINNKFYPVKSFFIELEFWIRPFQQVSPNKTISYEENGNPILNKVDYEFPTLDKKLFMSIAKDPKTGNLTYNGNIRIQKNKES